MTRAEELEQSRRDGFACGVAWAVALSARCHIDAEGLLKESGISLEEFKKAKVVSSDLASVRRIGKKGRLW